MNRELRERISEALDGVSDEVVRAFVEDSLSAEKTHWVQITCKTCRKPGKYPVEIPDLAARGKLLDILTTQSKGKPTETKKVEVEVNVRQVEKMTEAELELEEARLVRQLSAAS